MSEPTLYDQRESRMAAIQEFQRELAKAPQVEILRIDTFAPGLYARSVLIPAGTVAVGAIHRHAHLVIMSQGDLLVETDRGLERVQGFRSFSSPAGIKRMVQAFEDTIFTTVHATDLTDPDEIWREMIEPEADPFIPLVGSDTP